MNKLEEENQKILQITQEIINGSKIANITFTGKHFLSWNHTPANEQAMKKIISRVKKELNINLIITKIGDKKNE